jgi:hypothetical protein
VHNKNFKHALRKAQYAISVANFFLFWVLGKGGKGNLFFLFFFYWGWGSRHPSMEWKNNHVAIYLIVRRWLPRGTDPRSSLTMLFFILFF